MAKVKEESNDDSEVSKLIVKNEKRGFNQYKDHIEPKSFLKDAWRLGFTPAFTEEYFIEELEDGNFKQLYKDIKNANYTCNERETSFEKQMFSLRIWKMNLHYLRTIIKISFLDSWLRSWFIEL